MSNHEDKGDGPLVPSKKPDLDKQFQLRITVGLAAATLAQALAEGSLWSLVLGLLIALDAWRLWRNLSND